MAVICDYPLFTLHTKNSTYQMMAEEHGFLLHLYYGKHTGGANLSYLLQPRIRGLCANPADAEGDRALSLDTLPQEYSVSGIGDFRESCLGVRHADGSVAADLRYASHVTGRGKGALTGLPACYGSESEVDTLEIALEDVTGSVRVTLSYAVFEEYDVIARSARIQNIGAAPVELTRALSCCVDFFPPAPRDVITFYGRHMGERNMARTPARHGKIRVDSLRGASSPQQSPFVMIAQPHANETAGECFAFSFVYSGSFIAQAEVDQTDQLRFVMGIHPQQFGWRLEKGGSFQTPEVLCCFSPTGFDLLSNRLHAFQLNHLMRGKYKREPCPILLNSWEAAYYDFDENRLLAIAESAKSLGVELFVLDDGWFGKRDDDTTSLGDWRADLRKLGHGLRGLSERIHGLGLGFGLWVEPEMVSPDSDLMREHPDWCLRMPGREPALCRSQLVLDMSRPEVVDAVFSMLRAILSEARIDYIKWDMNRNMTDVWSAKLPPGRQGEVWHRCMLGVYELFERLNTEFPDLLLESCSSGGGRYDAGMLYYSPQVWASDNTDAINRLTIQYGNSFGFPMKSMGSHVSAVPNHQTGRSVPLSTRGVVAMAGTFGYELDATSLTEAERHEVRAQIARFKDIRGMVHDGTFHRLTDPSQNENHCAWMSVAKDGRRAVVSYVCVSPVANPPEVCIRLRGLDPLAEYTDEQGHGYSGAALMNAGLVMPVSKGDYPAVQILLSAK